MAMTMIDKPAVNKDKSAWSAEIAAEFERERKNPNLVDPPIERWKIEMSQFLGKILRVRDLDGDNVQPN